MQTFSTILHTTIISTCLPFNNSKPLKKSEVVGSQSGVNSLHSTLIILFYDYYPKSHRKRSKKHCEIGTERLLTLMMTPMITLMMMLLMMPKRNQKMTQISHTATLMLMLTRVLLMIPNLNQKQTQMIQTATLMPTRLLMMIMMMMIVMMHQIGLMLISVTMLAPIQISPSLYKV